MSSTIHESTSSAKALSACMTFNRLDYQFQKTQSFVLKRFFEIDSALQLQSDEVNKTATWFKTFMDSIDVQPDQEAKKLLRQLQS